MTREQLKAFVTLMLPDNTNRDITAQDLRDSLMEAYDSALFNASGGGVALPLGFDSIVDLSNNDLNVVIKKINDAIVANTTALIPFTYDPTGSPLKLIIAAEMEAIDKMEISGDSPEFVLRSSIDLNGRLKWMDKNNVERASLAYDEVSGFLTLTSDAHSIGIDRDGRIIQSAALAPVINTHLTNKKYVDDMDKAQVARTGILKVNALGELTTALTPDTEASLNAFDNIEFDYSNTHMHSGINEIVINTDGIYTINYQMNVESNANVPFAIYLTVNGVMFDVLSYQDGKGGGKGLFRNSNITLDLGAGSVLSMEAIATNNTNIIIKQFELMVEKKVF